LVLLIKIIKDIILGFLTICYAIGSFVVHIGVGISFVFAFLHYSIFGSDENAELARVAKNEKKQKQMLEKARKELEKKNKVEEEMIHKLNEAEEKKKQKDLNTYVNENVKREKRTFSDALNLLFAGINAIPTKIIGGLQNSYNNSVFVKNSRNKKDINRQALLIDFDSDDAKKSKVKVVYELEKIFGEEVINQIAFIDDEKMILTYLEKKLGKDAVVLYENVSEKMEKEFYDKYYKNISSYKGAKGIIRKIVDYKKIDYKEVLKMMDKYKQSKSKKIV